MDVVLANHSSYPGVPGDAGLSRAVREQIDAGLDLITDGVLGWSHPPTALLASLDGVRLAAAAQPGAPAACPTAIVEAKVRRRHPIVLERYRRAAAAATVPVKMVLTGPFTLSRAAVIATTAYRDADALAEELAVLLAHEVAALAAIGAPAVQIDEPLILAHVGEVRRLRELLEPVYDAAAGTAQMIVATYGADASPAYAQLNSLPADLIAVDCTYPGLCDAVAATGAGKPLAFGIVDATSPVADDPVVLFDLVERLLHRYVHPVLHLQPSCGLGALAPEIARRKLETVVAVGRRLATRS